MRLVWSVAVLAAAAGCAPASAPPAADEAPPDAFLVRQQIDATLERYLEAVNAGDWEASLAFYSDDPRFRWVEAGRTTYRSKRAVESAFAELYPTLQAAHLAIDEVVVSSVAHGYAMVGLEFVQALTLASGQHLEMSGIMSILMHDAGDGAWRFLIGHSTTLETRTEP